MYEKVRNYLEENHMIRAGDIVLAGISGGGDSMAMLSLLKEFQKNCAFRLIAVHVHHGIRGEEADRDERLVRDTCERWKVPFSVYHYDVPELSKKWKTGTEETGRMVRREAFRQEMEKSGADIEQIRIALAHNENDVAETMIHHLCRGTGLRGMAAMRPAEGRIIRPVLCLSKEEILQYLEIRKVPHILDSSNLSEDYTRNRIRHRILPAMKELVNPNAVSHLAGTALLAAQAEDYLEKQSLALLKTEAAFLPDDEGIVLSDRFWGEEEILVSYGLMHVFEKLAGKRKDFTSGHIEDVKKLSGRQVGRKIYLPYGLTAQKGYEGVLLQKEKPCPEQTVKEISLSIPGEFSLPQGILKTDVFLNKKQKIEEKKYTKWLDYDKINHSLCIRTRKSGDYLIIDEKGSRKKLNRYFIDEKVPSAVRDQILLVAEENEILWILGGRINERYRITPDTERILQLKFLEL